VTLATLSVLLYTGLLAYVVSRHTAITTALVALGGVGWVFLLFVVVRRWDDALPWALVLLGVAYTIAIEARGGEIDEAAPLVAAGLLLCGELASWSIDEAVAIEAERAVVLLRSAAVAVLTLAGGAAAAAVVALAAAPIGGGLGWTMLGAAAAVAVVAIALRLARSP
jgi:hypothetical protein